MPVTFNSHFDDTEYKNRSLTLEIEGLRRFITPDDELLEGLNMLEYRIEREKASIAEIAEMLDQKSYVDPTKLDEENEQTRKELLEQTKEHQKDIKKLKFQSREIPKAIQRLEAIKNAKQQDVAVFTIPKDISRKEVKAILNEIEERLKQPILSKEKRMLTYLQGNLETVKTMLDTDKEFDDVNFYVHQNELKYVAKLQTLHHAQTQVATNMLENILQNLTDEQQRLRQNNSPIHQHFTRPIAKIEATLKDVKQAPKLLSNKVVMKDTVSVVNNLSRVVEREKAVSPSFKDRLRNFVNGFRSFMNHAFNVNIPEVESLKSRTLTNMFDTQKQANHFRKIVPQVIPDNKPLNKGPSL
ncbi:MAG: hypothetical protein AB7I18_10330 [Candidatus Berkiella sp.]